MPVSPVSLRWVEPGVLVDEQMPHRREITRRKCTNADVVERLVAYDRNQGNGARTKPRQDGRRLQAIGADDVVSLKEFYIF